KLVQVAIVHMKEDFTRIQVLRNDIARNLVAHNPLDYNLISEQTGEIHRRAARLNVYMLAHAPNDSESNTPVELQNEEMIAELVIQRPHHRLAVLRQRDGNSDQRFAGISGRCPVVKFEEDDQVISGLKFATW